jgi:hypothetical protein
MRVVPLTRVVDPFHARVLAARLGAEGIVTQLRGGIDNPYPMGLVEVLVDEADLELAQALLLADEVEAAFESPDLNDERPRRRVATWAIAVVLACLILFAYVHTVVPQR